MSEQPSRVAIVTGAGSGIGRATALALLADGWSVLLVGRREEPLRETAGQAAPAGGARAVVVPCDVTDAKSVDALFAPRARRVRPPRPAVQQRRHGRPERPPFDEITARAVAARWSTST